MIDSRDKRASVLNLFVGSVLFPNPDGSLDQADRQHTAKTYRGISAGGGPTTQRIWTSGFGGLNSYIEIGS